MEVDRRWREHVLTTCLLVSVVSLAVRLVLQLPVSLWRCCFGWLHFFLCGSLLLARLLLLGAHLLLRPDSLLCQLTAVATHWATLSALAWLHTGAVHVWKSFRSKTSPLRTQSLHCGWHLYAWLSPLLLVVPAVALDFSALGGEWAAVYDQGQGRCWVSIGQAGLIFLVGPAFLVSLINVAFIAHTHHIMSTQRTLFEDAQTMFLEVKTCTMLVVLVGVTWLLGLPATVNAEPILDDIFTLAHASLGFLVVVVIVMNSQLRKGVTKQARGRKTRASHHKSPPPPNTPTTTSDDP
ncbi:adhesion G-protein coupled receptor D1-like [Babylonia areolata]|uniref:adhesion G-protein coupled receptor D1-like n=1 Tax=Babylonia areolata TaxID=304850 RepID=UPI003FD38F3E